MQNEQNTVTYDTGCKKCLLFENSKYCHCGLLPMKMVQNYKAELLVVKAIFQVNIN